MNRTNLYEMWDPLNQSERLTTNTTAFIDSWWSLSSDLDFSQNPFHAYIKWNVLCNPTCRVRQYVSVKKNHIVRWLNNSFEMKYSLWLQVHNQKGVMQGYSNIHVYYDRWWYLIAREVLVTHNHNGFNTINKSVQLVLFWCNRCNPCNRNSCLIIQIHRVSFISLW